MPKTMNLVFKRAISIRHKAEGLREPSGLAFDSEGNLWTVSDNAKRIFQINMDGEIVSVLDIRDRGLEGICFDQNGNILTVDEDDEAIVVLDNCRGKSDSYPLRQIDGYDEVSKHFKSNRNNGLEGITIDQSRNQIVAVKEAEPKLLIYLSQDLSRIEGHHRLKAKDGFRDPEGKTKKLDVSGICHDHERGLFWIVSDKASAVFGFDRTLGEVVHSFPLRAEGKKIKQVEGIATSDDGQQMFVVSDQEAQLYEFQLIG